MTSRLMPLQDLFHQLDHDIRRNYLHHYLLCVGLAPRPPEMRLSQLTRRGYEIWPVLDPVATAEIDALVDPEFSGEVNERNHTILEAVLTPDIERRLQSYLCTNFAVNCMGPAAVEPLGGGERSASFCWHVDIGPTKHLKLILYLNDEHDGGTEFLSRETTHLIKRAGYTGVPVSERVLDLTEIGQYCDIEIVPEMMRPRAGEALVFEPANCLHKGVYPTYGVRRTLQLVIVPWMEGWRRFFDRYPDQVAENQGGFPHLGDNLSEELKERAFQNHTVRSSLTEAKR